MLPVWMPVPFWTPATLENTFMFATGPWKKFSLKSVGTPILRTSFVKASIETHA